VTHRLVPSRTLTLAAVALAPLAACTSPPPTPAVLSAPAPPKPQEVPASAGFNEGGSDGDLLRHDTETQKAQGCSPRAFAYFGERDLRHPAREGPDRRC
jgi:hypothetical protein